MGKRRIGPATENALGFTWLMRYMSGESYQTIGASVGRDRKTVAKYVERAADKLTDAAQERILQELFPLAVEVYRAKFKLIIEKLNKGELIETTDAERIMTGMLVFDRPQAKDRVVDPNLDEYEVKTLAGLMVKRIETQKQDYIDAIEETTDSPKQIEDGSVQDDSNE